jgi:hypothetical protein
MSKERTAETGKPQRLQLQVPQNVNLAEMSDAEIESLALEMSRKAAGNLPKGATLTGVEGVTLSQARPGVGVEVGWSRGCGRADLTREGLVVNPEVFVDPMRVEELAGKSVRITTTTAKAAGQKASKSKKK